MPTGIGGAAEVDVAAPRAKPPRRWNKGVWIRFGLAILPLVVFSVLGIWGQHRW